MKEYALYKGDEILSIGTIEEIAKDQNLLEKTVRFYSTPSHKNRIVNSKNSKILIRLDD